MSWLPSLPTGHTSNLSSRAGDTSFGLDPQAPGFRSAAPDAACNGSGVFYFQAPDGNKHELARGNESAASPISATHTMFPIPDSPRLPTTPLKCTPGTLEKTPSSAIGSASYYQSPLSARHPNPDFPQRSPSAYLNATLAHSRGCSDVASTHMPDMYDNNRPRSRSDAPKSPNMPGYSPPQLGLQGMRIGSGSLVAPSPQRRLFPEANANVNGNGWPNTRDGYEKPTSGTTVCYSPSKSGFHGHYSQGYKSQIPRLSTVSPTVRGGTPGGVQLPLETIHGPSVNTMAATCMLSLAFSSAPGTGSHMSLNYGRQYKTNAGSDGASAHTTSKSIEHMVADGEFQESPTSYKTSSTSPASELEHRTNAKYLAALIKSGATEEPHIAVPRSESYRNAPVQNSMYQSGSPMPMRVITPVQPVQFVSALSQPTVPYMEKPDPAVQLFMQVGRPGYKTLQNMSPFAQPWKNTGPSMAGVVRITDIPYSTTRAEVVAFFGRNARLVAQPTSSPWYAIHIIMERATAKSMDCYVEFETPDDASIAVSRIHNQVKNGGRHPRIGERKVGVQLTGQEELMKELFPRAKCVQWHGQNPVVQQAREAYSSGFQGFVSSEEMHMTVKYAMNPQRSRFAVKHIQRTYESMISLLNKYPWWAHELYTLEERNRIWKATRDMIFELAQLLRVGYAQPPLDFRLLEELLYVGLSVPSFSEQQRAELMDASMGVAGVPRYVSQLAKQWPFETVRRGDESSEELLQYYAALLKQVSSHVHTNDKPETSARHAQLMDGPFGVTALLSAEDKEKKTMAAVAVAEWSTLDYMLRQGAGPDQSPASSFSSSPSRAVTT